MKNLSFYKKVQKEKGRGSSAQNFKLQHLHGGQGTLKKEMKVTDAKENDIKENKNVKNRNEGNKNEVMEKLQNVKDQIEKLRHHVNREIENVKNQHKGYKNEVMEELNNLKDQIEKLSHCVNKENENVKNQNEGNKNEFMEELNNVKDQIEKLSHRVNYENGNGSSLGIEKGNELPVQVEQQDVKDELVLSQNDGCEKRQLGAVEKCNKGMSDTRNVKDMKNPDERLSAGLSNLKIDSEYSEAKPTQSSDNASAEESKNFNNTSNNFESTQPKSADASSTEKKFNKFLEEPLKKFRIGFGDLKGILDKDEYVLQIATQIKISDNDKKSIIFTDHGGGNHALYFLELLKWHKPNLLIEEFQNHLKKPCYDEVNKVLMEYNGKEMFQKVSHKDIRDLSFKLVPLAETNVSIWKDLAGELNIDYEDVAKIQNMGKRPANFSRTEKLFEIITMRSPGFTIGDFLKALKELELNGAYELMEEKILYNCK